MNPTTAPADIILTASMSVTPDELRVAYQIENRSRSTLAVYDGAGSPPPGDTGSWPELTENVYVSFESPDRLHLKRVRPPTPEGVDITFIELPPVSRIDPGAVRRSRFALKLPVSEYSEYFPDNPEARWEERTAREVQLWIGYFRATPETEFTPLPESPHIYLVGGELGEEEVVTALQTLTLPVRVRTDPDFERV